MNRFVLAAGSLTILGLMVVVGCGLTGAVPTPSPTPAAPLPTAEPTATPGPTPQLTPEFRPFVLRERAQFGSITISLRSGWSGLSGNRLVYSSESDTGIEQYDGDLWIYGDPCSWSTTRPDFPATTVDEIIAALASQASRDASTPADISIDDHAGQSITLHVPADIAVEQVADNATFPGCDDGKFSMLTYGGAETNSEPQRYAQGPGQIDECWVMDVDGVLVLFDLFYWPDTPQAVIDDLHAMVESATFGQ